MTTPKHQPATALPWTRISDHMLKEDGKTVNANLPHTVCEHCKKQATYPNGVGIHIGTKAWGVAQFLSLNPAEEHDAHLANARYAMHSANAYPKLVKSVRDLLHLAELIQGDVTPAQRDADALLRELGESV